MKKLFLISALSAVSLSAHAQGFIYLVDRQSDVTIHIFAPQLANPSVEATGDQGNANGTPIGGVSSDIYYNNGTDGNYAGGSTQGAGATGNFTTGGSTIYTGGAIGNTRSGFATPAGAYNYNNGADYTVQLWAAVGANQPLTALQPVSQYTTTILTSSTGGGAFKGVIPPSDPGIPGTGYSYNTVVTVGLYVWYNGGTGLTLAQAQNAGDPWGVSPLDNISHLGNTGTPPSPGSDVQGLESFSLMVIPEPGTVALGVIGASTILYRRRKT